MCEEEIVFTIRLYIMIIYVVFGIKTSGVFLVAAVLPLLDSLIARGRET